MGLFTTSSFLVITHLILYKTSRRIWDIISSILVSEYIQFILVFCLGVLGLLDLQHFIPLYILFLLLFKSVSKKYGLLEFKETANADANFTTPLALFLVFLLLKVKSLYPPIFRDSLFVYLPQAIIISRTHLWPLADCVDNPTLSFTYPPLLTSKLALLFQLLPSNDAVASAVPLYYSLLAGFLIVSWIRLKKPGTSPYVALSLLALCPLFLYYSGFFVLQEAPILFFTTATLLCFSEYLRSRTNSAHFTTALAGGLLVPTKVLGSILFLILVPFLLRSKNARRHLFFIVCIVPMLLYAGRNVYHFGQPFYPYNLAIKTGNSGFEIEARIGENTVQWDKDYLGAIMSLFIDYSPLLSICFLGYMLAHNRSTEDKLIILFSAITLMVFALPTQTLFLTRYFTSILGIASICGAAYYCSTIEASLKWLRGDYANRFYSSLLVCAILISLFSAVPFNPIIPYASTALFILPLILLNYSKFFRRYYALPIILTALVISLVVIAYEVPGSSKESIGLVDFSAHAYQILPMDYPQSMDKNYPSMWSALTDEWPVLDYLNNASGHTVVAGEDSTILMRYSNHTFIPIWCAGNFSDPKVLRTMGVAYVYDTNTFPDDNKELDEYFSQYLRF